LGGVKNSTRQLITEKTHTMKAGPVLYAEDEPDDAFFLQLALKRAGVANSLRVVKDGQEAIEYLAGTNHFSDRTQHPLPDLILLDLNLPRKSGFDVLKFIQASPQFVSIPVLILSSSTQESDIKRSWELGARDFIVKPTDPMVLQEIAASWKAKWLS
jgi:CheY-like chemotaxis protein